MNRRALIIAGSIVVIAVFGAAVFFGAQMRGHQQMKSYEAELKIDKDIDLGIILDTTSPLKLAIPITNRADRVITIQNVAKDCSCTSVKLDKLKLAPGETTTLRVVTNLTGRTSFYEGNIIVQSDAAEGVDQIRIRGRITGQIRIRPERATVFTGDQRMPGNFSVYCDDQDGKWSYAGFASDDSDLHVELKERETTPTTSVFDGTVDIKTEDARKKYRSFQTVQVTLKFVNASLDRHFDLKYGVDVAVQQSVTVDPPQVMFVAKGPEQKRRVLVQSAQALNLDAVRCDLACVKASLERVGPEAQAVDLVFTPTSALGGIPEKMFCELLCAGKTVGSVPINIVEVP